MEILRGPGIGEGGEEKQPEILKPALNGRGPREWSNRDSWRRSQGG